MQSDPEIMKLSMYERRQIREFNPFNIWGPSLTNAASSYSELKKFGPTIW